MAQQKRKSPAKPKASGKGGKTRSGVKPRPKAKTRAKKAKTAAKNTGAPKPAKNATTAGRSTARASDAGAAKAPAPAGRAQAGTTSAAASMEASTQRRSMRGRRRVEATFAQEKPRPPQSMYLRLTFPGGDVVVFQPPDVLLFGRSDECLVVLPQSNVSRRHAEIRYLDGRFRLRDLGSTNGTFRNADRAGELDVRDGDVIQVGDVAMLWEILVADHNGLRPIRDRILTDAAARMKRERDPCAFLWLARMSRLRRKLDLPDSCTHLVLSLPAGESVDVLAYGYDVACDGQVTARHKIDLRLAPGEPLRSALARATEESSYSHAEVAAISRGAREGALPLDLLRLGFGGEGEQAGP